MDTSPAHSVRPRMLRTAMPVACSKRAASSVGSGEPPVYATCMVDELVRWVEGDQSPGPVVARARRRRRRAEPRSAGELGTRPHAAALPVSAGRALPRQRRRRRRCQLPPASKRAFHGHRPGAPLFHLRTQRGAGRGGGGRHFLLETLLGYDPRRAAPAAITWRLRDRSWCAAPSAKRPSWRPTWAPAWTPSELRTLIRAAQEDLPNWLSRCNGVTLLLFV